MSSFDTHSQNKPLTCTTMMTEQKKQSSQHENEQSPDWTGGLPDVVLGLIFEKVGPLEDAAVGDAAGVIVENGHHHISPLAVGRLVCKSWLSSLNFEASKNKRWEKMWTIGGLTRDGQPISLLKVRALFPNLEALSFNADHVHHHSAIFAWRHLRRIECIIERRNNGEEDDENVYYDSFMINKVKGMLVVKVFSKSKLQTCNGEGLARFIKYEKLEHVEDDRTWLGHFLPHYGGNLKKTWDAINGFRSLTEPNVLFRFMGVNTTSDSTVPIAHQVFGVDRKADDWDVRATFDYVQPTNIADYLPFVKTCNRVGIVYVSTEEYINLEDVGRDIAKKLPSKSHVWLVYRDERHGIVDDVTTYENKVFVYYNSRNWYLPMLTYETNSEAIQAAESAIPE